MRVKDDDDSDDYAIFLTEFVTLCFVHASSYCSRNQ